MTRFKSESSVALPILALLGAVTFWGMSFVSIKVILNAGVPPMTMTFLRFVCASIILYPILKKSEPQFKIQKGDRFPLILSGLFGVTLYFFFESTGLKMTSASNASLITAVVPVLTIAAEYLFYKKPIHWHTMAGVLLSIGGVYFIIQHSQDNQAYPQAFIGNLLMVGACIAWVIYIIVSKKLNTRFSGLSLTTYQSIYGALSLLPLALLEYRSWVPLTPVVWLNILYLAVFCTAVGYFLHNYALLRLDAIITSSYINLIPVVGVIGSVTILKESITLQQVIAGIVIILGVFIVNKKNESPSEEASKALEHPASHA